VTDDDDDDETRDKFYDRMGFEAQFVLTVSLGDGVAVGVKELDGEYWAFTNEGDYGRYGSEYEGPYGSVVAAVNTFATPPPLILSGRETIWSSALSVAEILKLIGTALFPDASGIIRINDQMVDLRANPPTIVGPATS
jgi:hypothetical protein